MATASSWFARGLIITFVVTALCTVGAYFLQDLVMFQSSWLGYNADMDRIRIVKEYGELVFLAYPAHFLLTGISDFTAATMGSGTSIQVFASFIALICNVLFAYLFIYEDVLTPIDPSWKGFKGAPIATVCTYYVRLLMTVIFAMIFACTSKDGLLKYLSQTIGQWSCYNVWKRRELLAYLETVSMKFIGMGIQSALLLCILLVGSNEHGGGHELLTPDKRGPNHHNVIGWDTAQVWDNHFHARIHKDGLVSKHDANKVDGAFSGYLGIGGTISVACAICILTIYQLPLNIFNGVAVACADRVSVSFTGFPNFRQSKQAALRAVRISLMFSILCAIPFMVSFIYVPRWVGNVFTGDVVVTNELEKLTPWLAVIVFFDAISSIIMHGVYTEVHATTTIPAIRVLFLICFLPSAYVAAFVFKHGNVGIMYAWCATSVFCCSVIVSVYWYYTTDAKWDVIWENMQTKRGRHKATIHDEARPLLQTHTAWNIFHAHSLKHKVDEEELFPDYIQAHRDSPSMLSMRAGGCIW